MCLFPMGGWNTYLIPPSEKASKLADYLKVIIGLHFTLAICLFLSILWVDGAFDLFGAAIGYMAIRNPMAYNLQQVLCYTIFCGMDFFWSCIKMIMYFAKVSNAADAPAAPWQFYIYIATLICGPLIYILASVIGYYLYKELKLTWTNTAMQASQMGGDPYGGRAGGGGQMWGAPPQAPQAPSDYGYGGGGYGYSAGSAPRYSSVSVNAPTSGGFKPFTGEGHTLA